MPSNVSLAQMYNESGKTDNLGYYIGAPGGSNFSLNTLIQAIPPLLYGGTASLSITGSTSNPYPNNIQAIIIQANCGNLSGYPAGTGGGTYNTPYPQGAKNISLGDMEYLWDDHIGWDTEYTMYYKFVPTGFAPNTTYNKHVGNYADAINKNLYKAGSKAPFEGSNYPGVNYGNYQHGPMDAPQSASAGLRLNNSQSLDQNEMPFTGCLTFSSASTANPQYVWVGFSDGSGRIIPPGSGSYKVPPVVASTTLPANNFTAMHMFWIKCPHPQSIPGRNVFSVFDTQMNAVQGIPSSYNGISCFITGNGGIGLVSGKGGSSSSGRRIFTGPTLQANEWNFVCIRASSVINYNNKGEFGSHIKVWRQDTGWSSGSFSMWGASGAMNWETFQAMVYNPRAFGDDSEFSGSIGHHYIFNETWNDNNKITHVECEMARLMTNSGSYGLYTS